MLNVSIIAGRLTRKPELKYTQSNVPVVSFSLACEDDFKDQNGNTGVDFIDVVAWRGTAEMVAKYCDKGRLVGVKGRIKTRSWKDNDGNNRKTTEIHAEKVYFLGESKRNAEDGNATDFTPTGFEEMVGDAGKLPF